MRDKECRHRWRIGSGIGDIVHKELVSVARIVWCEKCGKKDKVHYFSDIELQNDFKMKRNRRRAFN